MDKMRRTEHQRRVDIAEAELEAMIQVIALEELNRLFRGVQLKLRRINQYRPKAHPNHTHLTKADVTGTSLWDLFRGRLRSRLMEALLGGSISLYSLLTMRVAEQPLELDTDAIARELEYQVGERITQVTNTIKREVGRRIVAWYNSPGVTMQTIINQLRPAFGINRASLIATTETTNLHSLVQTEIMTRLGYDEWWWETKRDHLVCVRPMKGPDGQTYNGCRALHGKRFKLGQPMPPDGSHVSCRCNSHVVIPTVTRPIEAPIIDTSHLVKFDEAEHPRDKDGEFTSGKGEAPKPEKDTPKADAVDSTLHSGKSVKDIEPLPDQYNHPKVSIAFVDKVSAAKEGDIVGTIGNFMKGKSRKLYEQILDTPVMVLNKPIVNHSQINVREGLTYYGAFGRYHGEPTIFVSNLNTNEIIKTLFHEAGHALRAKLGRSATKQDIINFNAESYDNLPEEISAQKLADYAWSIDESKPDTVTKADFVENEHPRDKGGEFTSKGGEGAGGKMEKPVKVVRGETKEERNKLEIVLKTNELERVTKLKFIEITPFPARGASESYICDIRGDGKVLMKPESIDSVVGSPSNEIVAYEISKAMGLLVVPVTVYKDFIDGRNSSAQSFIENSIRGDMILPGDIIISDKIKNSFSEMLVLDIIGNNLDRRSSNWLYCKDTKDIVAIDNGFFGLLVDAKEYGVKSLEVLHQKIWTEVQNNWKIMGGSGEPYINPEHIKKAEQFINSEQYSNLVYAHFSKDKADALINFSRNYGLNFLKNHEVKK